MDVHPKHFGIVLKFDKLKRKVQLLLQVVNKINAEKVLDRPFDQINQIYQKPVKFFAVPFSYRSINMNGSWSTVTIRR